MKHGLTKNDNVSVFNPGFIRGLIVRFDNDATVSDDSPD